MVENNANREWRNNQTRWYGMGGQRNNIISLYYAFTVIVPNNGGGLATINKEQ